MKRSRKIIIMTIMFFLALALTGKSDVKQASAAGQKKWVKVNGTYKYKSGGRFVKKKIKKIGKKYYYFNSKGYRKSGWVLIKKKKYYFSKKDGAAVTGLQKIGKSQYLFSQKGALITDREFYEYDGKKYSIASNGKLKSGFVEIDGNLKYFNKKTCALVTTDFQLKGEHYLVDDDANLLAGLQEYQGRIIYCNSRGKWFKSTLIKTSENTYYADADGFLVRGLYIISHSIYYFDNDYSMRTGVVMIGDKLYFFDQNGKRVSNSWITTQDTQYYAGTDGVLKRNCWFANKYFDNNGCVVPDAVALDTTVKGSVDKKKLDEVKAYQAKKLMIVAHPDDETLWGGAHLSEGNYFVVCLTHGNDSKRKKEFDNVMKASGNIGIMLDYPDEVDGVRSEWLVEGKAITKDLNTILRYKNWSFVVTHNPEGEYGHIQHKITNRLATQAFYRVYQTQKLYYFGRHYSVKNLAQVAASLPQVSQSDYLAKKHYLSYYVSQAQCVSQHEHMSPYENWVLAPEWE